MLPACVLYWGNGRNGVAFKSDLLFNNYISETDDVFLYRSSDWGIPMIIRESKIHAFSWRVPAYISLGVLIVVGISVFPFRSENIGQLTGLSGF